MREIKFRAWDGDKMYYNVQNTYDGHLADSFGDLLTMNQYIVVEQFTGLRDKNGLKDIYEGDIISPEGEVIANIHEGKERSGINLAITAMGCKSWRNTEQEAIKRGCFYAQ